MEKSLKIKINTLGENHSSVADTYNNLGAVFYDKGEIDKAI